MNEHLVKFWLFATHWTELDTFDTEEELNDEIELLHRQNLPTKVRQRTKKDGGEELVLYVKQADRDYARYCTGWRPGMSHLTTKINFGILFFAHRRAIST